MYYAIFSILLQSTFISYTLSSFKKLHNTFYFKKFEVTKIAYFFKSFHISLEFWQNNTKFINNYLHTRYLQRKLHVYCL